MKLNVSIPDKNVQSGDRIKVNGVNYYFTQEAATRVNGWLDKLRAEVVIEARDRRWYLITSRLGETVSLWVDSLASDQGYPETMASGTVMRAWGVKVKEIK